MQVKLTSWIHRAIIFSIKVQREILQEQRDSVYKNGLIEEELCGLRQN